MSGEEERGREGEGGGRVFFSSLVFSRSRRSFLSRSRSSHWSTHSRVGLSSTGRSTVFYSLHCRCHILMLNDSLLRSFHSGFQFLLLLRIRTWSADCLLHFIPHLRDFRKSSAFFNLSRGKSRKIRDQRSNLVVVEGSTEGHHNKHEDDSEDGHCGRDQGGEGRGRDQPYERRTRDMNES
ncbi:hypothetical protein PMAYCL1PPCAC_02337 [Pristionchus mayeri]|uniref:Uncharacterized protein n=1 Tax=Pristionchus mayeri TaxID=1317129 RepID=A0AAN4Z6A7_9BILA|nr:hypothetical protein PMAYCL1PPCAC_02337 [Pristionchus mayeri]